RPPTSRSTWLPESTMEWIASASIDEDRVSANATNLVAAIPRLATSAATTALVPPPALMAAARFARPARSCLRGGLPLGDGGYRHRVEAVRQPEVDRCEVGYRDQ